MFVFNEIKHRMRHMWYTSNTGSNRFLWFDYDHPHLEVLFVQCEQNILVHVAILLTTALQIRPDGRSPAKANSYVGMLALVFHVLNTQIH